MLHRKKDVLLQGIYIYIGMRKKIIILFLFFATTVASTAQSTFKPKFKRSPWDTYIGVKGGAMYSYMSGIKCTPRITGLGGVFVEAFLTKQLSVQQELMFVQQGVNKLKILNAPSTNETTNLRINYVYTDFLLKQYFGQHFNIFTGIHIGRVVYAKQQGVDIKGKIKEGDITFPIGASVVWHDLSLDARYHFPFHTIAQKGKGKDILGNAKNTGFLLTLGYRIQIF